MSTTHHRLLERQIRKYLPEGEPAPELRRFLNAISDTYRHGEQDRELLNRAMEISSMELMEKNKELQEKNDILDSFVYRVSHDLKTPANNLPPC